MEDLGNYKVIFYIVLAILYFLFSGKKKASKTPPPVRQREDRESQPPIRTSPEPARPMNRPSSTSAHRPKPQAPVGHEPYSLEDILKQFGQSPEEKKEKVRESLDVPKLKVPKLDVPTLIDYNNDLKDEEDGLSKVVKDSKEKLVSKSLVKTHEESKENEYAEMLKDLEGIKTAFIASEIFNRKY